MKRMLRKCGKAPSKLLGKIAQIFRIRKKHNDSEKNSKRKRQDSPGAVAIARTEKYEGLYEVGGTKQKEKIVHNSQDWNSNCTDVVYGEVIKG